MLRVEEMNKQPKELMPTKELTPTKEIWVTRYSEKVTEENNKKIIERVPNRINISKVVNESAKMIKKEQTADIISEMEKLLSKRS